MVERHSAGGLVLEGRYWAKRVVNTAPWSALRGSSFLAGEASASLARLRHSSLVVSLHDEAFDTDAHWCYLPSMALRHHREFFIRNYAPLSTRGGVMRETNLKRWDGPMGALCYFQNDHAYPIPSLGWASAIADVLMRAEAEGIFGLGRWGQWQYFNSDVCIHEAMRLALRLGHSRWQELID